jgi:hypothetical protein
MEMDRKTFLKISTASAALTSSVPGLTFTDPYTGGQVEIPASLEQERYPQNKGQSRSAWMPQM